MKGKRLAGESDGAASGFRGRAVDTEEGEGESLLEMD